MDKLVTLITVRFDYEAQLIKSRLMAASIPCLLAGEYVASSIGRADWRHPLGAINVQVRQQDLESAQEALRPIENPDAQSVRLQRPAWHSVISVGLHRTPWPLRVVVMLFGGFYLCSMAALLLAALLAKAAPEFPNFLKP